MNRSLKTTLALGIGFVLISAILISCKQEKVNISILRMEQDLFNPSTLGQPDHFLKLQQKYGFFYNSFAENMLNISEEERSMAYAPSMSKFVSFPGILQLKKEVDSVFPDLISYEKDLSSAMGIYHKEFPNEKVPAFVSYLSEFAIGNATTDTVVGIGLDFYLGEKYPLYPALEFPDFMIAKLRKEYLVPNSLKAFAIGKYESQLTDKRFLAMMLFEGKVKYFTKTLLPNCPDSLIFGLSAKQMQWCAENEQMIWAHLIEAKMLFNQDPSAFMRYFNDGPFTIANGVPQQSSPCIGIYAGYKIIEKYMHENSDVTLEKLMQNNHWDEILKESAYKP